ncbi:hypothetical protein GGS26DRAFT_63572 [Hypomontagnella submonticulosa]|nr:hypothetical protein GGS26DRAFT_63572 [Hypomontagnella submonticulosa]
MQILIFVCIEPPGRRSPTYLIYIRIRTHSFILHLPVFYLTKRSSLRRAICISVRSRPPPRETTALAEQYSDESKERNKDLGRVNKQKDRIFLGGVDERASAISDWAWDFLIRSYPASRVDAHLVLWVGSFARAARGHYTYLTYTCTSLRPHIKGRNQASQLRDACSSAYVLFPSLFFFSPLCLSTYPAKKRGRHSQILDPQGWTGISHTKNTLKYY